MVTVRGKLGQAALAHKLAKGKMRFPDLRWSLAFPNLERSFHDPSASRETPSGYVSTVNSPASARRLMSTKKLGSIAAIALVLALLGAGGAVAQQAKKLPDFAPLLPEVRAKTNTVDPQKGYLVQELKPNVFMITDGGYESAFVTTGQGVVLFDAPPSFARHIVQAMNEVTKEPIIELVYSHLHVDHIGGAGLVARQVPKLEIVAEEGTARILREMQDPERPIPTRVFKGHETLRVGAMTAEMRVGYWHSPEGDLMIFIPDKKFVMAIDALSSGAVPFMGLDLTMNMHDYLQVFDQLLELDFDVMVPGHHSIPARRTDVQLTKEYVVDVYRTVKRIHESNHKQLVSQAVAKYGKENSFAVARVLSDHEAGECAKEIEERWATKLEDVDVWAESHCRTALVYAEWDVGPSATRQ
jgi:glyoxylase-like metal-dependent hydrolase (beta-lactamase superfamily II)